MEYNTYKSILLFLVLSGMLGLIFSTFWFALGFHEADHCQDLNSIELRYDIEIISMTLDGNVEYTPTYYADCYVKGIKWMFTSFFIGILFTIIFMGAFMELYLMRPIG